MVKYIRIQSVFCMKKRLVYKEGGKNVKDREIQD